MKKTLVVFYSRTGNNKYLAEKIAINLGCDIEPIRPKVGGFLFLMLAGKFNKSFGIKPLKHDPSEYERVILCGPVWMGTLIAPIRDFIKKYKDSFEDMHFVSCCGSSYEEKDKRFGHELVFQKAREVYGGDGLKCLALPITLVLPEEEQKNSELIMNTRLSDENFTGEISTRFDELINLLKA